MYNQALSEKRWLIIATIMLVAILEVMDSTIVNVSLPAMMPTLGANQNQITWVLTSYVVASAVMIPLTGFLSNRLGQKRLLLLDVCVFMFASIMCGLAQSLSMMIVFRLIQGAFGSALIPISQSILRTHFPLNEQGKAMAIWGMGIMAAPVLGPTLGGFITYHASWRWIFYINVPICIVGILMTLLVIKPSKPQAQKTDWLGIACMFIGVGTLQLFLDQGNEYDWFSSNFIDLLALISVIFITLFILRCFTIKTPAVKLQIFRDRNFAICTLLMAGYAGCIFAFMTIQPIMLETLFGYTAITAGYTMTASGLISALGMILTAALTNRVNVKYLLISALLCSAVATYWMSCMDLQSTQWDFVKINALLGFSLGLFMVPLSTYALATIKQSDFTEASGLYSYGRMLGTSIGISLLSTLVSREMQINWNTLGAHVSAFNNNLRIWLHGMQLTRVNATTKQQLADIVHRHAGMTAFIDGYIAITAAILLLIIPTLFIKKVNLNASSHLPH